MRERGNGKRVRIPWASFQVELKEDKALEKTCDKLESAISSKFKNKQ